MYRYDELKPAVLTDEGQRELIRVRDNARRLLRASGAVAMWKLLPVGDTWTAMAYVDRLVEIGDLREIKQGDPAGQDRIFIAAGGLLDG